MSTILYAVSQNDNLIYDKDGFAICPRCGALLRTFDEKMFICVNHKDGEQYRIMGNKQCDYIGKINSEVK